MKKDYEPLVSIIVPVYNVEPYLRQCIDSVVCQTLKEIEIILVDDGSTDNSGTICDEYALKDERIHVIHKANKGLACARNDGIDNSSAPYIMFVDGDDWVDSQFCETPYLLAVENSADIVLFNYKRIFVSGKVDLIRTKIKTGLIDEEQALAFNVTIWDAAWNGFYGRKLFNEVRYPAGKLYEDTGTSHRLIHTANRIYYVNDCLYNYRTERAGSITTAPETRNHPDRIEMRINRLKDLCDWGYHGLAARDALFLIEKYGRGLKEYEFIHDLLKCIKVRSVRYLSKKQKTMLVVFKLSPQLFDCICVLAGRRIRNE